MGQYPTTGRFTISERAKLRFLVIYEDAGPNYSAYVPDLPGCVSTGATKEEIACNIREAINLHLEGMREDGEPFPEPAETWTEIVEVDEPEPPESAGSDATPSPAGA